MKKFNYTDKLQLLFYGSLRGGIVFFIFLYLNKLLEKFDRFLPAKINNFNILFLYLFLIVLLIFFIDKIFRKNTYKEYGFKGFNIRHVKYGIYGFSLLFPIALVFRILDPSFDFVYAQTAGLFELKDSFYFIFILLLAVLFEEVIERSLIQSRFNQFYSKRAICFIVSLNFAIYHFVLYDNSYYHAFMAFLSVFLGSLILTALFEYTRSIFSTIIVHLFSNIIVALQIFLHVNQKFYLEFSLFLVWGLFFVIFSDKSFNILKDVFRKEKITYKYNFNDITFFVLFSIILPLLIMFIKGI